jgi:predicted metal-binding protein
MIDLNEKDYVVVVQCDIVKQRCSGFLCEQSFHERTGGFADYPKDRAYRTLYMTCGGCCGLAVQRKLTHLARLLKKKENMGKERIVIQLSSCMTRDNFHGPVCPHLDYIKVREDTRISPLSEKRRQEGLYREREEQE